MARLRRIASAARQQRSSPGGAVTRLPAHSPAPLVRLGSRARLTVPVFSRRRMPMATVITALMILAGSVLGGRWGKRAKREQDAFDRRIRGQSEAP